MKKQSAFKMKGFSGFGNSPVENNGILDTKFKDVPKKLKKSVKKVSKKASDAISNVKEKIGNTTVRDILKSTPNYKLYKKIKTKFPKSKNNSSGVIAEAAAGVAGGIVSGAKKGLKERGLGHKLLVTKRKITNNTKMKAPYKRPVGPRVK